MAFRKFAFLAFGVVSCVINCGCSDGGDTYFRGEHSATNYIQSIKRNPNTRLNSNEIDEAIELISEAAAWCELHPKQDYPLDPGCDFFRSLVGTFPEMQRLEEDTELFIRDLDGFLKEWRKTHAH